MNKKIKIAIYQNAVSTDKRKNIKKILEMIASAAENRADIFALPEMFNSPYDNSKFAEYGETVEAGPSIKALSEAAKAHKLYIVAGSIPEIEKESIYNTSVCFDKNGDIIGKHRKVHLFDIDVEGQIRFKESDVLSAGNQITVIDTEFCKIGIAICFDMRFPELFRIMALKGAEIIFVPGAFNMVTGPAHWELLIRTRALDNQLFVVAASPARDTTANYVAYGNSMIADPWGNVLCRAAEGEELVFADIDLEQVGKIRNQLPLLKNRRSDLYEIYEKIDINK